MTEQKITAEELAKKQRDISIAEFFEKNRHLLGFDNNKKALLTTIKEAVDNSLDACEEARVLPEIIVEIINMGKDRFRVIVEDNGPGIIKKQIPKIFAKLLYGSKFHSLKQSRGQQGIGISASVLYGQLTTGRPARITSKTLNSSEAHYYELGISTATNEPKIIKENTLEWAKEQGTKIEIDLEASYQKGLQSVDEYLKETAIANPHVTLIYVTPDAKQIIFPRATDKIPKDAKEIKPHPYGVELGILIKMLNFTKSKTIHQFLTNDFSRVGVKSAAEICQKALIEPKTKPESVSRDDAERLINAIRETKILAPSTDCIVPITSDLIEKGLRKEINAEFYCSVSRPPSVYRGNPFIVEAAIAYGGELPCDKQVRILRYANKVPLLYQQGACSITKSIISTNWKSYGLQQSNGSLPVGPVVIFISISSVWAPFTSEAKEAIAHYPEIIKEIKLALQECGRKLHLYVSKKRRVKDELKKRGYIEKYIPSVAEALQEINKFSDFQKEQLEKSLTELLEKKRGTLENIEFDKTKNKDYDEDFAKIGKEEIQEEINNE